MTRVNGQIAYPELILRNGDRIDNTVHRHEPPVANQPILVLHKDDAREFVVISKPGSLVRSPLLTISLLRRKRLRSARTCYGAVF